MNRRVGVFLMECLVVFCACISTLLYEVSSFQILPARSSAFSEMAPTITTCENSELILPGGGIYFYWQAGAITYIRDKYDLSHSKMTGASAGALAATLGVSNVDFEEATKVALQLCDDYGVWNRRGGLRGIWGPIIQEWLQILLPDDVADVAKDKVCLCRNLLKLKTFCQHLTQLS